METLSIARPGKRRRDVKGRCCGDKSCIFAIGKVLFKAGQSAYVVLVGHRVPPVQVCLGDMNGTRATSIVLGTFISGPGRLVVGCGGVYCPSPSSSPKGQKVRLLGGQR